MVDVLEELVHSPLYVPPTVVVLSDERTVKVSSVVTCPVKSFEGFLGVRQEYVEEVVGFVVFRRPPGWSRWRNSISIRESRTGKVNKVQGSQQPVRLVAFRERLFFSTRPGCSHRTHMTGSATP
jgi:hypothetical protein